MGKIVDIETMKAIERAADTAGLTYADMMENAGRSVAEEILDRWGDVSGWRIVTLVGSGNNGGDALVAGHYLIQEGAEIAAYLTKPRGEDDPNLVRLKNDIAMIYVADDPEFSGMLDQDLQYCDLILDGLLGTGFQLPMRGQVQKTLAQVRTSLQGRRDLPLIVAIDCPSGVDSDTGEVAPKCLPADLTVTLAAVKPGLIRFPAADYIGELAIGSIGPIEHLEPYQEVTEQYATTDMIEPLLPVRERGGHKGTFGTVLVVAGSRQYPGSAALAGLAAYRAGAGLVHMAVPASIQAMLVPVLPEAIWSPLPDQDGVLSADCVDGVVQAGLGSDCLVVGPGFGISESSEGFIREFLACKELADLPPILMDADALKLVGRVDPKWEKLPPGGILTPHPGEMAIMSGLTVEAVQRDRLHIASIWSKKTGQNILLKGAFSVMAAPDTRTVVLPFASSALATAGSGDVLSGCITGLIAQGITVFEAGLAGAFIHGLAALIAADQLGDEGGVVAGDLCDYIPSALEEVKTSTLT